MSLFLRFLFHFFFSLGSVSTFSIFYLGILVLFRLVDAHMKINFKIHVETHVARDILVLIRLLKPM